MKQLIVIILLFAPMTVLAEACPKIEYAELKDMKKDELQKKYCEFKKYQASKKQDSDSAAKKGQLISLDLLKYSFQCESEAKRLAEVMERSFAEPPAKCEDVAINAYSSPQP